MYRRNEADGMDAERSIGMTEEGRAMQIGTSCERRPTEDGRGHEPIDAVDGALVVYRRQEGMKDRRVEIFTGGGMSTLEDFRAFLKRNGIAAHERPAEDGATGLRLRVMGHGRFEVPSFITLGFDQDGRMEFLDAGALTAFPLALRSASYGWKSIRLMFDTEKGGSICVTVPSERWSVIEGYRMGPDALVQRLRLYGVDFSYSENDMGAVVSFLTDRGRCEVLYDRFSSEAYAISGIRHEAGGTDVIRVHAFAESLCTKDGRTVMLPFLFDTVEKAAEDWRRRPSLVKIRAVLRAGWTA